LSPPPPLWPSDCGRDCARPLTPTYPRARSEGGGLCVGGQLYEQQAEQKQALRIRQLERELAQAKLKLQHVVTTEEMARSQARQLQTTLDMLLDDGGGGVDGPDAPGGGGAGGGNR
jgi:hypothetical protein